MFSAFNPSKWSSGKPTLRRPGSCLHLTHPKRIRTWSRGQPSYGAQGAVRGSVPCSRALQSWYWIQFLPARDSNPLTLGYKPDSLTIRPRLPLYTVYTVPILDFWGPYTEWGGGRGVGMCGWDERMDATHSSVVHFVSNHTRRKRSSLSQLHMLSTRVIFFKQDTVWYSRYMIWMIFM